MSDLEWTGKPQQVGVEDIDERLAEWFALDRNPETLGELHELIDQRSIAKLSKLMLGDIEFGTAGLRGFIGAGFTQMNDVNVIRAATALYKQLYIDYMEPDLMEAGIVIGFDHRHFSLRWAQLTAAVFLHQKVQVYLASDICPTPFVSWAIKNFRCKAGVMVTASHNPREYNGYKVYTNLGTQINSPFDRKVFAHMRAVKTISPAHWDLSVVGKSSKCADFLCEAWTKYYESMVRKYKREDEHASWRDLFPVGTDVMPCFSPIVYTPLHGVGQAYVDRAVEAMGYPPLHSVPCQMKGDPDFPTTPKPNPEEGPHVWKESVKVAEEKGVPFIIANDPDADRLALAEKQPNGSWHYFHGNEIGTMLGFYLFLLNKDMEKKKCQEPVPLHMVLSTVSSKMLRKIGLEEGFTVHETLTGFKWIAAQAEELEDINPNCKVLFCYEQALGYMCGTDVLDKDGISAAAVAVQMYTWAKKTYGTLKNFIEDLYDRYGYHAGSEGYYETTDKAIIARMFANIRNSEKRGDFAGYPDTVGRFKVSAVRDLTVGYDSSTADKRPKLPVSNSSQMITFTFENGAVVTIRTSGTEPKVKWYAELGSNRNDDRGVTKKELQDLMDAVVEELYQPGQNGFTSG